MNYQYRIFDISYLLEGAYKFEICRFGSIILIYRLFPNPIDKFRGVIGGFKRMNYCHRTWIHKPCLLFENRKNCYEACDAYGIKMIDNK